MPRQLLQVQVRSIIVHGSFRRRPSAPRGVPELDAINEITEISPLDLAVAELIL